MGKSPMPKQSHAPGEIGDILRREGLYSSHLTK